MTLADTNVWLALAIRQHEHHETVSAWFAGRQVQEVAFCRPTQNSLLRLVTTRAVLDPYEIPPLSNAEAWRLMDGLLASPMITFVNEPPGLDGVWRDLSSLQSASPKVWMDAFLAAFAIASGCRLASTDRAFERFHDLDFEFLG